MGNYHDSYSADARQEIDRLIEMVGRLKAKIDFLNAQRKREARENDRLRKALNETPAERRRLRGVATSLYWEICENYNGGKHNCPALMSRAQTILGIVPGDDREIDAGLYTVDLPEIERQEEAMRDALRWLKEENSFLAQCVLEGALGEADTEQTDWRLD